MAGLEVDPNADFFDGWPSVSLKDPSNPSLLPPVLECLRGSVSPIRDAVVGIEVSPMGMDGVALVGMPVDFSC